MLCHQGEYARASATRIGCKILSSPEDLEEMIRLFIIDLQ